MATEQAMQRSRGLGVGGALIGLGVLALVAIVAFILLSVHSRKALRTDAVNSAASSLAASTPPPRN
jgi:divalent metal cation (Fe/Co/Zn/Cd) transporter